MVPVIADHVDRVPGEDIAVAVKTARELALLPYRVSTFAPVAGDRRGAPRRESPAQQQPKQRSRPARHRRPLLHPGPQSARRPQPSRRSLTASRQGRSGRPKPPGCPALEG
jgi:hypothetical protein